MSSKVVNFAEKLSKFSEHWSPRVVAEMNDYQIKVVKIQGEFVWHDHKDTDEVFWYSRDKWVLSSEIVLCS